MLTFRESDGNTRILNCCGYVLYFFQYGASRETSLGINQTASKQKQNSDHDTKSPNPALGSTPKGVVST